MLIVSEVARVNVQTVAKFSGDAASRGELVETITVESMIGSVKVSLYADGKTVVETIPGEDVTGMVDTTTDGTVTTLTWTIS